MKRVINHQVLYLIAAFVHCGAFYATALVSALLAAMLSIDHDRKLLGLPLL